MITIIIPAFNEESTIEKCLMSIYNQKFNGTLEIIVIANGCIDSTVDICNSIKKIVRKKYEFKVLELLKGNKNNALRLGDKSAVYGNRLYLDADVVISESLIEQIQEVFETQNQPVFVSGTVEPRYGKSYVSKAYSQIWAASPYIRNSVPGCGCYGVNQKGRELWGEFETVYADDKFVRLLFSRNLRVQVSAKYFWPLPKGCISLVKSRIRWSSGNRQLIDKYPELSINESNRVDFEFIKILIKMPFQASVFCAIYLFAAIVVYIKPIPKTEDIKWFRSR